MASLPRVAVADPTFRLIPSRFPPVAAFATVADAADLDAVMELEGWTNDRLVQQRLARLPRDQWVFGTPNASVVMASFLHAAPAGLRFSSGDLGAWYAALSVRTAIAEVAHHLRREAANTGLTEMRGQYRTYVADLAGRYVDVRKAGGSLTGLYDASSYAASQAFGEAVRVSADDGIVYASVRHAGGTNVVCYRPRKVLAVRQAEHFELAVPLRGRIVVRVLTGGDQT
jgi:RES domain-containing protein